MLTYDELEAIVRVRNSQLPVKELALGDKVAWMTRSNGKADEVSHIHRHYENGRTFCRLAIPPQSQHLPILPSLKTCRRCEAMSRRALEYARIAAIGTQPLKVSA